MMLIMNDPTENYYTPESMPPNNNNNNSSDSHYYYDYKPVVESVPHPSHSSRRPGATTRSSSPRTARSTPRPRSTTRPATTTAPATTITEPTEWDVLCAKEKIALSHAGTQRFRTLIDSYQARYAAATTKDDKMTITKEIVRQVEASGRFLRYRGSSSGSNSRGPAVFEELTHLEARDKTSHALRTACKRYQRQRNRRSATSSGSSSGRDLLASSAHMPLPFGTVPGLAEAATDPKNSDPPVMTTIARPPIVRRFTTNELAPLPLHSSSSITAGGPFSEDFLSLWKQQQVLDDSQGSTSSTSWTNTGSGSNHHEC